MGKKVAFWGSVHGQVATTSNVVAASSMIGMEYMLKTLVSHTHHTRSTLESAFMKPTTGNDMLTFSDTGLDALERLARSNRLTPSNIQDYSSPLIKERFDLLMGTTKSDQVLFESVNEVLQQIFICASERYDVTLLDTNSGAKNLLTQTILDTSDLIVVNLNQNLSVLDRFFEREDWIDTLDQKPYLIVLGQYDPNSFFTPANIAKRYGYKKQIYTVPHSSGFLDACNNHAALDFFLRNRNVTRKHDNHFFINEVRKFAKAILDGIGINTEFALIEGDA